MSLDESRFPASSRAEWAAMVTDLLKGAAPETLDRLDEDGLLIRTLYDISAQADQAPPRWLPQDPAHWVTHGWDICQPVSLTACNEAALKSANQSILTALESGATSLWLTMPGDCADQLPTLLDKVVLSAIGLVIDCGPDSDHVMATLEAFAAGKPVAVRLTHAPTSETALAAGLAQAARGVARGVFLVDGWRWHNQGLTAAAETGAVLAGLAAILRAGHAAGRDLADLVAKTAISIALPADMFAGITKLRALRQTIASLLGSLGLSPEHQPRLIGRPSLRMMALLDQDENMLRTTTALLGGAIGGADSMAAFGHDYLAGESEAARRLARLTQVMMIAESGLSRSLDPAGGAAFIEDRTMALAEAGWTQFQAIEAAGGLPAFVAADGLVALTSAANGQRDVDLRAGRMPMVGVTLQPTSETPASQSPGLVEPAVRPAALIEQLRNRALQSPRRILILQAAKPDKAQAERERALKRLLAIAGLQPVVITLTGDVATAIAAARPDIVIDCAETGAKLEIEPKPGQWLVASNMLARDDQIGLLEALLGEAAA